MTGTLGEIIVLENAVTNALVVVVVVTTHQSCQDRFPCNISDRGGVAGCPLGRSTSKKKIVCPSVPKKKKKKSRS